MACSDHCDAYGFTRQEAKLFDCLMDREIHSRDALQQETLGRKYACKHLVPVYISRMREKLADHGLGIRMVRNQGSRIHAGYQLYDLEVDA